jgi:hypothetical protein
MEKTLMFLLMAWPYGTAPKEAFCKRHEEFQKISPRASRRGFPYMSVVDSPTKKLNEKGNMRE